MAMAVQQIHPIAHLPLVLGVLRRLEVATVIDRLIPPHPAHVLSCGRGVAALVLAILDGDHALYKVGKRLEERGMVALLQPGLTRASLHDYRLGHILEALFAAHLNEVYSAIVLKALEVYTIPTIELRQLERDGKLVVSEITGKKRNNRGFYIGELFLNRIERSSTAQHRHQWHHPQNYLYGCGRYAPKCYSASCRQWHAQ